MRRSKTSTVVKLVGVGTASMADAPGSLTPALPTGVQTNDLILVFAAHRASTGDELFTTPAGYTNVLDSNANSLRIHVDRKVAGASESDPTVNVSNLAAGETAIAQVAVFRNADTTTPIETVGTVAGGASGLIHDIGPITGLTPTTAGDGVIVLGVQRSSQTNAYSALTGDGLTWNTLGAILTGAVGTGLRGIWAWAHDNDGRAVSNKTIVGNISGTPGWRAQMFTIKAATAVPSTTTYTLDVTLAGTGSGTVTGPGIDTGASDFTQDLTAGTVAPLVATPAAGSVLGSPIWTGDGTGTSTTRTVTMSANKAVTAHFEAAGGGVATIPGTGSVLQEDLAITADPTSLWKANQSAFSSGSLAASDLQITRLSSSPDPHVPVGQISPPSNYRRLGVTETTANGSQTVPASTLTVTSTANFPDPATISQPYSTCSIDGVTSFRYTGKTLTTLTGCSNWSQTTTVANGAFVRVQSIYDAGAPNSSYRTQLVNNSSTNTFYAFTPGVERILYLSVRRQNPSPLAPHGTGSSNWAAAQLLQIKETNAGGLPPIIAMGEHRDGAVLVQNYNRNPVLLGNFDFAPGLWVRFALAIKTSNDPAVGYVQLWGDLDGAGSLVDLSGQIFCRTAYDGVIAGSTSTLSIGPYYEMIKPAIYRDYAGVQVCAFTHP